MIAGAVFHPHQYPGTHAKPVQKQNHQCHNGVADADGGKCFISHKLSDDDAVHGIVGQLKDITQHQRRRKAEQQRHDSAFCQILYHKRTFSCTIEITFLTAIL